MDTEQILRWLEDRKGAVLIEGGRYETRVRLCVEVAGKGYEITSEFPDANYTWAAALEVSFDKLTTMISEG